MVYKRPYERIEIFIKDGDKMISYKHSEETKRKLSKYFKEHPINYWLGKKRSRESVEKGILKQLGKHHYPKTEFKKGNIPWNTGLKGTHFSFSTEFKKGISPWIKGKHHSEETIKKMKEKRALQIVPVKDTKIEVKIQDFLKKLGIEFLTHQYINIKHAYQCDIFIPTMKMIIECDGDYWHGNPLKYPQPNQMQIEQIEEDVIRTKELLKNRYKVLRIWEQEINQMNIKDFIKKFKNEKME
jgi:G:T-mismatch repair DNA endonuclease (very short patch repair protein)